MTLKYWLPLAFLACPISAETTNKESSERFTLKEKVTQAITKFEGTTREHWAYQVSRYENEEGDITSSIEGFGPNPDIEKQ